MKQADVWIAAAICAGVAVAAGLAEWRHLRRGDLDRVGLMPWGTVSVLGFIGAVVAAAVGVKG